VTLSAVRRKRIDRIVAVAIAIVVVIAAVLIYRNSDARATDSVIGAQTPAPAEAEVVPTSLNQSWVLPTNPALGAVASPYGVVITADDTGVTGHDATTGEVRWSYDRTNTELCAVGSGDVDAPGVTTRGKVRGVMVVSAKNGWCSQVMLLDPDTGERHYYRTSPNQVGGSLAFGGPYAAWLGPSLLELWRDDLVRTIQYGDLPDPPKPNAKHLGCTFTDIGIADDQFATVEHCGDDSAEPGPNARVVINWATPDSAPDKPDDQDVFKHNAKADIDTGSPAARIVGITADRVAVLVSAPEPAVVVYDETGAETSRTPVDVPAESIEAADQLTASGATVPTPSVRDGTMRYSLIDDRLLGVSSQTVQVEAPPETSSSYSPTDAVPPTPGVFASDEPSPTAPDVPETVQVKDLTVRWTKDGALGLPASIGDQLLLPVTGGLTVFVAENGNPGIVPTTIPVDRGDYQGRVDATSIGSMVVETRGGNVVGLVGS
jgi:hypothetical protein